ncbi:unnamed protein product [Staurois parvus]|uniref:Uncharacterized protein n=1 Tax=Staurois parvus TaxID=386267 RepID=A0ABN9EIH8_9NEOB|nr:unnamed protein product [Staurois parvus]
MLISAGYQFPSVLDIGASSVLAVSAHQCWLSVPISDACQFPSVLPISSHHFLPISAHQCHLSVSISAAYRAHQCSFISAYQ